MEDSPTPRAVYRPSGRIHGSALLTTTAFLVAVAVGLAFCLAVLTRLNGYAVGWIWIPVTGTLCLTTRNVVRISKCRHRGIAFALGLLGGFITLVGMYHIDQCSRWGVGWERFDRLPGFIAFRMETDAWVTNLGVLFSMPLPEQIGSEPWLARPGARSWHWAMFLVEFVFFVVIPARTGWVLGNRPFCEQHDDWMANYPLQLTHQSATALREALNAGTVTAWVDTHFAIPTSDQLERATVVAWHYPRRGLPEEARTYFLSIGSERPFSIRPEEAAVLGVRFVGLASSQTAWVQKVAVADACLSVSAAPASEHSDADINRRFRRLKWLFEALRLGMVLAFLGGGLVCGLVSDWLGLPHLALVFSGLVTSGLVWLVVPSYWFGEGSSSLVTGRRWHLVERQLTQRPDMHFPVNDPGATYVEILPVGTWPTDTLRRQECEGGYLAYDSARGFLFEGEQHRYVIPLAAVLRCGPVEVTQLGTLAGLYAVVLTVRTTEGTCELPILALESLGEGDGGSRGALLFEWIRGLLRATDPAPVSEPPAISPPPPPVLDPITATTLPAAWSVNLNSLKHQFVIWLMTEGWPLVAFFLFFLATFVQGYTNPNQSYDDVSRSGAVTATVIGIGVIAFVLCRLTNGWSLTNRWANLLRYKSSRLREAIRTREGVGCDPDDPRALLVQLWLPVVNDEVIAAPDLEFGYLLLDDLRGEGIFEGERHRLVIPSGAIAALDSRLFEDETVEGSPTCYLSVHTRSKVGVWQIEILVERGLPGTTYHERGEALRMLWQYLVNRRPHTDT